MTGSAKQSSVQPSLRANGSRECAPDDRLREAIHGATRKNGLLRRFAPRNDEKHIEDGVTDSNFKQQL
jgi:hypothetical protein